MSFGREKALRSKTEGFPIKDRKLSDLKSESRGFHIPPHGTSYSTPWNKVFHPMEQTGRRHLRGLKVPPSRVECAASSGRRYGLRKSACYEKQSLKAKISLFFNRICKSAIESANPQTPVIQQLTLIICRFADFSRFLKSHVVFLVM